MVSSLNDWQKEKKFRVLNDKKGERGVKVIRSGDERVIDLKGLLVGDIALLEPGEIIPYDGIFVSGHNVKCEGATGESDTIKKVVYDDCIMLREQPSARALTLVVSVPPKPTSVVSLFPVPRFSKAMASTSSSLSIRRVSTVVS